MEESGDQKQDCYAKEATKTWGFRKSTIARREFMEEIGNVDLISETPRRSARPTKGRGRGRGRGKQIVESTTALAAAKRGRGGRKPGAPALNPVPSPASTDSHDASALDADGCVESKDTESADGSRALHQTSVAPEVVSDFEAAASDQAEDSDELTLRELQERARNRRKLEESSGGVAASTNLMNKDDIKKEAEEGQEQTQGLLSEQNIVPKHHKADGAHETSSRSARGSHKSSAVSKKGREAAEGVCRGILKIQEEDEEEEHDSSSDVNSEEDDPDAVYCICRQKHNNRFMICCDRCQEWFHGDCVGITEARGRLLEENGEDYICSTCSPCQSPVNIVQQPLLLKAELSSSSESLFSSSAGEGRPSEDDGIKGKIRKASSQKVKRRIKVFKKVEVVVAVLPPETEENTKEEASIEDKPGPKCIGPGCVNNALPESVYCGHQCIIRHAAVAMQTISEPKPQPEVPDKPVPKPVPKIQKQLFLEKLFRRKPVEKPTVEEDGKNESVVSLEKDEPTAAPQPCDVEHKEMGEQQSSAVPASVFYKSTIKKERDEVESKTDPKQVLSQNQSPSPSPSSEGQTALKAVKKAGSLAVPFRKPNSSPLPSRAKKTMPGSQRLSGPRQQTESPQSNKTTCTPQAKQCQSQEAPDMTQSAPGSSTAREIRTLPVPPAPVPPSRPLQAHPNMQMRQNIRRSLTDALLKRVIDSDCIDMSDSDVEKLAVNIEREMFNMYYTTDNKYKTKYKSLLLSLKDPKNKGLFYQVVNGQITPFKLTRMSQQELQTVQEITSTSMQLKEESPDFCANVEEPPSVHEDSFKVENIASSSEEKNALPQVRPAQTRKVSNAVSDIISSMLKDTTSEHRTHLFDLKCKICTGQIPVHDDPEIKNSIKEETRNEEEKTPFVVNLLDKNLSEDPTITESPASPVADDSTSEGALLAFSPPVIPAVSIVSITGRDPRKVAHQTASSPSPSPAQMSVCTPLPTQGHPVLPSDKEEVAKTKVIEPVVLPPPPPMPKSILMKPSATSVARFYNSVNSNMGMESSNNSADNETSQFLSKQDIVWKGFLNMPTVAKFVTKGYIISGTSELLKKELPDTIHIGGRILPQTVWEYVERVKTSVTKELSLIRFHPASDEEEVAYVSLFSYFNSRRRFGVVSNICNNIKDLYLIPLCSKESVPSVLLPLEGPGLEQNRPNILIGLAICQKLKRPGTLPQETSEKRVQMPLDTQKETSPIQPVVSDIKHDESEPYDPDIPINTTPPGSHSPIQSQDTSLASSSSLSGSSVLSNILSAVNPTSTKTAKTTSCSLPAPSATSSSSNITPLQTILNTLFGNKKQGSNCTENSEPNSSAVRLPVPTLSIDPVVQQYQHTPTNTIEEKKIEDDDNDRPYDPEEEYNPAVGCQSFTLTNPVEPSESNSSIADAKGDDDRPYDPEEEYNFREKASGPSSLTSIKSSETKASTDTSALNDIAYDPEDETVFDEIQTFITGRSTTSEYGTASTASLSEQQKMLDELNRQIEEQKRQLEEQEEALRLQRAAVGVSMAHFSVSDALMSPPPCFGREPDDAIEKMPTVPEINPSKDPRQCRKDDKDISLCENMDNFKTNLVLTQATFLASTNISAVLKKDSDTSSVKAVTKMSTVDTNSTSNGTTELPSATIMNVSELQESTHSSSRNRKRQHSHSPSDMSGKRRKSHTSRRENHSSPKRSRHDHRSYHRDRASRISNEEADKYHRRSRRSAERSPRRSRHHSDRKDRVTSRQRVRGHYKDTSSRHRNRREEQSTRLRSTQSRRSGDPENDHSHQKEPSPSESAQNHTEQAQNSGQLQKEVPQDREHKVTEMKKGHPANTDPGKSCFQSSDSPHSTFSKHDLSLRPSPMQSKNFAKANTELFVHENSPSSQSPSMDQLHLDSKTSHSRDQPKELSDNFSHIDHLKVPPQKVQCISQPSKPHSFREPDQDHVIFESPKSDLLQKGHSQGVSARFHHRSKPQSELSVMQKDDQLYRARDQQSDNLYCNPGFSHINEQSLDSLQFQRGDLSWLEANHRSKVFQKTMQTNREDFSDSEKACGKNQSLSKPLQMQGGLTGAHRSTFSQSDADHIPQNKNMASVQRTSSSHAAEDQSNQRKSTHRDPHKRAFTLDEQDKYNDYPKRSRFVTESDFAASEFEDMSHPSAERYSGHFPLDKTEPQQRNPPYHLPRLQENDFLEPEARQQNIKDISPQIRELSVETDQFHHQGYPSEGAHSMARASSSAHLSEEHGNFHTRDQFEPKPSSVQWRDPQHRNDGIRGPPSIVAPRGLALVLNRIPRAHHPERFKNCGLPQNFGPRGPCLRPRIFDSAPRFGPRGLCSGPGILRGPRPQTLRQQGSSSCPENSFTPPQNFDPSSGPHCPKRNMDGISGPHQSRQLNSPIFNEMDDGDAYFSCNNDPRGHAAPQLFDKRQFDFRESQPPNFNDSRDYTKDYPFDEAEIDNTSFHHQHMNEPRGNVSLRLSDSRSHNHNSGSNSFINPEEPRHQREFRQTRRQNEIQSRNPKCGTPPHGLLGGPQFVEMETDIRGPQQFNEFEGQIIQRDIGRPLFEKPDILEGGVCERDAQMKGPRLNAPQNFKGQHMSAIQNKVPCQSQPFPPHFLNRAAPASPLMQKLEGCNAGEFQKRVLPRIQSDGTPKEPDIRPLRLSGPLLPTPPGGPIRLNSLRMQRPTQVPPRRENTTEHYNAGMNTMCFDDNSNHQLRDATQSHTEFSELQGENDSGQDSSPGKPWRRRRPRRREVRSSHNETKNCGS